MDWEYWNSLIKNPQYGVARWLVTKPDDQSLIPQTHRVEKEKWTPTEKYFWIPSSGFLHQCAISQIKQNQKDQVKEQSTSWVTLNSPLK